jgi:hypothetical protein
MKSDHRIGIAASLESRRQIIELILLAIPIAIGINLLSSLIDSSTALSWKAYSGPSALILIPILALSSYIWTARETTLELQAVIAINKNTNTILQIPRYAFSEELARVTQAVFLENRALKKIWDEHALRDLPSTAAPSSTKQDPQTSPETVQPLISYYSIVEIDEDESRTVKRSEQLLVEAIEFVLIRQLSLHLNEYFKKFSSEDSKIEELGRNKISDVLLQNRFLELLSRSWDERPIFAEANIPTPKDGRKVVEIRGTDGSIYSRFVLTLPNRTSVSRPQDGYLTLDTPRFVLKIEIDFKAIHKTLPRGFSSAYMGYPSVDIDAYKTTVRVVFELKRAAFLRTTNWEYFKWIDSLFDRLTKCLNFEDFLKQIAWEAASTDMRIQAVKSKKTSTNPGANNSTIQ